MTPQEKLDHAERVLRNLILYYRKAIEDFPKTSDPERRSLDAYDFCYRLITEGAGDEPQRD